MILCFLLILKIILSIQCILDSFHYRLPFVIDSEQPVECGIKMYTELQMNGSGKRISGNKHAWGVSSQNRDGSAFGHTPQR